MCTKGVQTKANGPHVRAKNEKKGSFEGGGPPNVVQNVTLSASRVRRDPKNTAWRRFFEGSYSCTHSPHKSHALKSKKTANGSRVRHNYAKRKNMENVSFGPDFGTTFEPGCTMCELFECWVCFLVQQKTKRRTMFFQRA